MPSSESRHLLPINTMLFASDLTDSPERKSAYLVNPTLADLQEAQDETITALPRHPFADETGNYVVIKKSFWRKLAARSRKWLCLRGQKEEEERRGMGETEKGKIVIGEPTEFRHVGTAAPMTRRRSQGVQLVDGDSEWEDVE